MFTSPSTFSFQYYVLIVRALCFTWLLVQVSAAGIKAQCNNTTVLSLTGPGTATWTAPPGSVYSVRITATGGGGGNITSIFFHSGGHGATMAGTFTVQGGQTIRAIAGDFGKDATLEGAGAGGGSGAVNCGDPEDCESGTLLIIAAGGNGGDNTVGLGGSAATNGDGQGGQLGGEPQGDPGGGGGGLLSDGESDPAPFGGGQGGGQVSFSGLSPGGWGSRTQVPNDGGDGMGGGGGGGDYGAGGAGGHTGGDGGNNSAASSFNSGSSQNNSNGANGITFPNGEPPAASIGSVTIVCLATLPVQLTDFKALIQKEGSVRLLWSTATEQNNLGYDVERSGDGRHWTALGFVRGNGTTTQPREYTFTDPAPLPGINYYRLKQTDTDGTFEYSPMVIADVRDKDAALDIFPNPSTTGELSVRAVSRGEGEARLEIFDWAGYRVHRDELPVFEGATVVYPLSMSAFPKGTYTARLEMPDGQVLFRKLLLQ